MMKRHCCLLVFCLFAFIGTNYAENSISIDDIYVRSGDTIRVPINLSNELAFTAFQMDVFVPEGISIASVDNAYLFTLGARTTTTHMVSSNSVKNGSVRVVVFSTNSDAFTDELGELLFVDLVANPSFVGPKDLQVKNILFTSTMVQEYQFPDVTVPINNLIPVDSIVLSRTSANLVEEDSLQLTAQVFPNNATNPQLEWKSLDTTVVKVTDGKIIAIAPGSTSVVASATDGSNVSSSCSVVVQPKQYSLSLLADSTKGYTSGAGVYIRDTEVIISATAREGYRFVSWNDGIIDNPRQIILTQDTTFTAFFEKQRFVVTFLNEDSTLLQLDTLEYGTTPEYRGETPTKQTTAQYTYSFAGWAPSVASVIGDATFTATYDSVVNKYVVMFLNEDSTLLQLDTLAYGTLPEYHGTTPTKQSTAQYTYTFAGWNNVIVSVIGNATYLATYTSTINKYVITFLDEDGTQLQQDSVEYGALPAYRGETPTKPSTAEHTYFFGGWTPMVVAVTQNATYTATYTESENKYVVIFADVDGTQLQVDTLYYGMTPVFRGTPPTKENTAQYSYSFAGWTPQLAAVTGDITYTAVIDSVVNTYTIMFLNEDSTLLQLDTLAYGSLPEYRGTTPTKQATAQYTYTFNGWDNVIVSVTGNASYVATYTFTTNKYVITFLDEDGTQLQQDSVEYGALPVYRGETPTKPSTAEHTYYFGGWTPTIVEVTQNATYTATYTVTENKYVVTFQNEDGTILQRDTLAYGAMPVYREANPTKQATAEATFTFAGWTPSITAVVEDAIYTATYDSVINTYVIMFLNEDSTLLQIDTLAYGAMPEYRGETPVKPNDGDDFFVFTGWEPEVIPVAGDAIYVATYERHGTDLDNVAEKQKPVKVMEDGKMYIIMPDGTKYSAAGRKVE